MTNDKRMLAGNERLDNVEADLDTIEKLLNTIERDQRIERLLNTHDEREKQLLDPNIKPEDIDYVKLS